MPATLAFVACAVLVIGGQEAPADGAKERAVAEWRQFTGSWTVTAADGQVSTTHVSESHPGVFLHRGNGFTVMVGWDAQSRTMHAFGFSTDDQPFEQHWRLVDGETAFVGQLVGTDERFRWSIDDGVWTMDFGSFGQSTATRDGDP